MRLCVRQRVCTCVTYEIGVRVCSRKRVAPSRWINETPRDRAPKIGRYATCLGYAIAANGATTTEPSAPRRVRVPGPKCPPIYFLSSLPSAGYFRLSKVVADIEEPLALVDHCLLFKAIGISLRRLVKSTALKF